jgi:hypothetical protein
MSWYLVKHRDDFTFTLSTSLSQRSQQSLPDMILPGSPHEEEYWEVGRTFHSDKNSHYSHALGRIRTPNRAAVIIIFLQGLGQRTVPVQNFNFWTYESIWTFGRTPWTGDQPDARPLPTRDNTTQKNADSHPCLKQDSNLRSQCSSARRQYVP